jgi:AcrR family transcriptional regulator
MTIYGYVRGKEDLLDAMVDAAVEDVEPAPGGGSWRDQLRELARTAHAMLVRHPALVQVRLRQPVLRPESLRFGEAALGILHAAGFDSREAAQAFRLLFTFVFGFAGLSPERTVDETRRRTAAALAGLPPEDFPNLTRAAVEATAAMAGDDQFEYGLERILDGLETRLA